MGFWRDVFTGTTPGERVDAVSQEIAATFAVDASSIDPAVFGLTSYSSPTAPAPRISRREAIQVGAVKRARDLIAGVLGGMPIEMVGPQGIRSRSPLFEQPERGVPRSVTMTRLFEDLLFEGVAWWRVTEFAWNGYPAFVQRVDPALVEVRQGDGVYVEGKRLDDSEVIRFDSPNDPLLVAGARAIRTCLKLDAAAAMYADEPQPLGYFSPADGTDPADDTEIAALLTAYHAARQTNATAYIPAALTLNTVGYNAEQIQLAQARQHAVTEIARVCGIDAEELSVAVTSRTYSNMQDRRRHFTDFVLGPYRQAVEDRLSMGDTSPNGYKARFDLSAFLRSDDLTRMQTYAAALAVGAITKDEIRQAEDRPPLTTEEASAVEASQTKPVQSFAAGISETFDSPVSARFEVDEERRTIKGLALPYGKSAMSRGKRFAFSKGTVQYDDVSRVKVLVGHDFGRAVGVVTALEDTDEGLVMSARIAKGAAGDEVLSMAAEGVWDGLSVGIADGAKYQLREGVYHAQSAPLVEISVTPIPSFSDARLTSVAASAHNEENPMDENTQPEAVDFSAVTDAIKAGFEGLAMPQREVVPATASVQVTREELPYRFDGTRGSHGFVDDLRAGFTQGDTEARQRLEAFMAEAFAVTTGNVSTLNVTQNKPELYVGNLTYTRPLWDLVSKGTITDKTPFTIPRFGSASGLVAAHTEGVEPTPGAFTATSQTVTPSPVSGKIEINREVWDQGGSPQADGIIWAEMVNAYYEALEAKIAAMLNGLSLTEVNLGGATNTALIDAVTGVVVDTLYARGGNRFTAFAADSGLFKALVNAQDTGGRKILPVVGPTNAQGQTSGAFDRVQLGNLSVVAAWGLDAATGVANARNSYLFVPSSVWAWASAPQRFTFEYQVKSIDMAIWGYSAAASLRDTDIKRIDYTTADV